MLIWPDYHPNMTTLTNDDLGCFTHSSPVKDSWPTRGKQAGHWSGRDAGQQVINTLFFWWDVFWSVLLVLHCKLAWGKSEVYIFIFPYEYEMIQYTCTKKYCFLITSKSFSNHHHQLLCSRHISTIIYKNLSPIWRNNPTHVEPGRSNFLASNLV